jgi:hypothetical protein
MNCNISNGFNVVLIKVVTCLESHCQDLYTFFISHGMIAEPMTEPIVFISRNRIKEGKINEFRNHYLDRIPAIFDEKPGTLAQLAYLNEETTEVIIIRLFPNTEALDFQIQGADERLKKNI